MGAYLTSFLVAGVVLAGLLGLMSFTYTSKTEALTVAISNLDQDELIQSAKDQGSKGQVDAILRLGEEPGDLDKTIPVLADLTMSRDELPRMAAGIALKEIGEAGVPYLKPLIESGDELEVIRGCSALKEMSAGGKIYLPLFEKYLRAGDSVRRKRALYALQGVGLDAVELVDLIVEALDDPDLNVQCMACRVLENLGPEAMPAEQTLLRLLKEGVPSVRGWAAIVLGSIGPTDSTDTAQLLAENLKSPLQIEKQRTLLGISHLGPEASTVAESVREVMNKTQNHVMPHAAFALWKVTGNADESLEVFKGLLDHPSYRHDSIEFVGKMQQEGAPLVGDLAALLKDSEPGIRELAIVALGNIGAPAAEVSAQIETTLTDEDPLIRYYAKAALKQIQSDSSETESK